MAPWDKKDTKYRCADSQEEYGFQQWYAITFAVYFMFSLDSAVVSHEYLIMSTVGFLKLFNPTDSGAMKPENRLAVV